MKKLATLLLALLLILGCVSCASTPAEAPETPADTPSTPAETPADIPADAPADDEVTEEPVEPETPEGVVISPDETPDYWTYTYGDISVDIPKLNNTGLTALPLVTEPTTLTVWRMYGWTEWVKDPADVACNKWMEEQTGVTVDWTIATTTDMFQIFLAGGDLSDIIVEESGAQYNGGIDRAIEDEVYVSLNDYLQYTPNFVAFLNHSDEIRRNCVTDEGTYYFAKINSGFEKPYAGPMVRGDWLAELGLDVPTTYDDWHDMLTTFKTEKGATRALMISATGYDTNGMGLSAGYDSIGNFYAENGTDVKCGFVEDGFRDYITMLSDWYAEDLIDKDFPSNPSLFDAVGEGTVGAQESSIYSFVIYVPLLSGDPNIVWQPVPIAKKTDDAPVPHFRCATDIVNSGKRMMITTDAVDRGLDVLAAKWIDFRYDEYASMVINYGIEGESWIMGEDGLPHWTDIILNNAEYNYDTGAASHIWVDTDFGGNYYWWTYQFDQYEPEIFEGMNIWSATGSLDWVLPGSISMTTEEGETYAQVYGDIKTYIDEHILKYITGAADIRAEWDSYVETCYQMGLQECIDIYQNALDRYNAR